MNIWEILLIALFILLGVMYICDTIRKTIIGVAQAKSIEKIIDKAKIKVEDEDEEVKIVEKVK